MGWTIQRKICWDIESLYFLLKNRVSGLLTGCWSLWPFTISLLPGRAIGHHFYYFRHRQGYSLLKSIGSIYRHYFVFGQVLIDKVAIRAGLLDRYTFEFDGIEHLKQVFSDQKGGILISAHLGNFEVADRFLDAIDLHCKINLVTSDLEHSAIKNYLESVTRPASTNYIIIRENLSSYI
ncbi:MAG: hypothetical protein KL787_06485 [Taibaiella sp.]|nr:hypothetical protein [Taibaiella sp.]